MTELTTFSDCKKDDLIVITGAGGFIAGALRATSMIVGSPAFGRSIRSRCRIGTRSFLAWKA